MKIQTVGVVYDATAYFLDVQQAAVAIVSEFANLLFQKIPSRQVTQNLLYVVRILTINWMALIFYYKMLI